MAKEDQTPVFSRPPFAHELLEDEEHKKRFNALPAWERHLVRRIIEHGDLERAAAEAGVGRHLKSVLDLKRAEQVSAIEALDRNGLGVSDLIPHVLECLEAKVVKFDKHQNPIACVDLKLKKATLEMLFAIHGAFDKKKIKDAGADDEMFEEAPA